MSDDEIISIVKDFALKNSKKDDIHGFPHVQRVYSTCIEIGKNLNANLIVLKISALLHDIGRNKELKYNYNRNHAEVSAEMALNFFKLNNFKLSQDDLINVIHCIKAHSFSNKSSPVTIEAKILSDSDKLDALGAIGLYRTIKMGSDIGQIIEHLEKKIIRLKDLLFLNISKELAKKRKKIILDFYKKIKKEV